MKYYNHQNGFAEGDKLLKAFSEVLVRIFGKDGIPAKQVVEMDAVLGHRIRRPSAMGGNMAVKVSEGVGIGEFGIAVQCLGGNGQAEG